MATRILTTDVKRLLCRRSRVVAYLPNLSTVVRHFRAFSSYDERYPNYGQPEVIVEEQHSGLPDPHSELLGTQDRRFPLPGMTGPSPPIAGNAQQIQQPAQREVDILTEQLPHERHTSVLHQFVNKIQEDDAVQESQYSLEVQPSPGDFLECVSQDCPDLLRKDFQDLFPERNLSSSPLTVITICQKTDNDMTGWNPEVEAEREQLLQHFIESAQEMCGALHQAGYWADFIDPSSGRPYLGAYTSATLFETDERYRHFGFEINDLGCCKVISHHLWGTHSYIGSLFTDAPCDHPILANMTQKKSD